MARLAIFRSMHNVRPNEQHRPSRAIELDAAAVAYFRLCDVEVGAAWALDRLTEVRKRMEAEAKLLESYAASAEQGVRAKITERLAKDTRYAAVKLFIELAREAEAEAKTLVLSE